MRTATDENGKPLSNHETIRRRVMAGIGTCDIPGAIRRYGLREDAQYLYADYMTRSYRIDKESGLVEWCKGGNAQEADFNEVLTLYDLLFYAKEGAALSGAFTPVQNLTKVQTTAVYAGKGGMLRYEAYWDARTEELAAACERLGGVPDGKGDVSYRIPFFQNLSMIMQFWRSDEDFPASLQFLFDENTLQFLHYETTWYVISHFLDLLKSDPS